ncbi:hypothetical protein JHK82_018899 [Glycine max]|uniref:Uncharacterized protein n=1 Tax=Glycine soja TaxID=3848 RepID=A0A0B2S663_GLYSO|nr:hypothetical protein JHK85_019340 [Glycine max]KAG5038081.1 hypothetical protein JHK86_018921 [Glycine max]KAG5143204.1 hypothetical protein JHK82_018899 [Glycine max]KHN40725.1 hypothetical protein glysoja_048712 [Glycine soja]
MASRAEQPINEVKHSSGEWRGGTNVGNFVTATKVEAGQNVKEEPEAMVISSDDEPEAVKG